MPEPITIVGTLFALSGGAVLRRRQNRSG
ncbi:PEP-CTERM sorting domain-containing protein [Synechococcus sp. PCC 7336]